MNDQVRWHASLLIEKYHERNGVRDPVPYECYEKQGNLLMYGGASALWQRLIGTGITAFDNSNAYLGVGDSLAAAAATQTDLQASSNKYREAMDSTYPIHSDGVLAANSSIVFKSTFETGDANFAWNEAGIFNASSSGRMLNRFTMSGGTKTSAESWSLTVTLSLA